MSDRFHPWRELRSLPGVKVVIEDLGDAWGYYDDATGVIHLDARLTQAERRCTLAHEMVHAERGDVVGQSDWHDGKQERIVDRIAACRLIPLDALADALTWAGNEWEVAEVLWVDVDTVRQRLRALTTTEKRWIDEQLARREESA